MRFTEQEKKTRFDIWLKYYRSWRNDGYTISDSIKEADKSLWFYTELEKMVRTN